MLPTGWTSPLNLLKDEIPQLEYEGFEVSQEAKSFIASLDPLADAYDEAKIMKGKKLLGESKKLKSFRYVQPNELEEIKKERPDGPRVLKTDFSEAELLDRLHGAWTGRACGCALGKPVEGIGMRRTDGKLAGRKAIKALLQKGGHWPLDFYFSGEDLKRDSQTAWCQRSWRENIVCMEPDDDIHYSLIGLKVLEEKGPEFTWRDVADAWNSSLPYNAICTAETQAILNYNILRPRCLDKACESVLTPEFTSSNNNPYREWIGAQIRADGWAYCCAGKPELAAEFAWRDARWTHRANGVYGEMFVAAMIAAAFVESDPARLVEIGLSEIPKSCRLAEDMRWALSEMPRHQDFESFMDQADERFKDMHAVHTVNNAVIVAMALHYGKLDPDKTACIAVTGALDTDCNGATAGSIAGAATGREKFGGVLAAPLNDRIEPQVFGFQSVTMKELAERTLKQWRIVENWRKTARAARS